MGIQKYVVSEKLNQVKTTLEIITNRPNKNKSNTKDVAQGYEIQYSNISFGECDGQHPGTLIYNQDTKPRHLQ